MSSNAASSPFGSRPHTGAASLDIVISELPIGVEFTANQLLDELRRRGLPERGAVREHLDSLRKRGHVERAGSGWVRLN